MLESTKVSRSLERKTTILWLEVTDIFAIMTFCTVLNLVFGGSGLKVYFVYSPTLVLGVTLVLAKRGQPEGFLLHFLRFHLSRKHLSSFPLSRVAQPFRRASTERQRR